MDSAHQVLRASGTRVRYCEVPLVSRPVKIRELSAVPGVHFLMCDLYWARHVDFTATPVIHMVGRILQ